MSVKNSIYLSEDLQAYLEEQGERYGIGKSAFVSMVLVMYKEQREIMNSLPSILSQMQQLQQKEGEKSGN